MKNNINDKKPSIIEHFLTKAGIDVKNVNNVEETNNPIKQYIKGGVVVTKPKSIIYNNTTYINPNDDILKKCGYDVKVITFEKDNNDKIKIKRANAYAIRADKHLIAYQAYKELGNMEKAIEEKELWIKERQAIDKEFPYINENVEQSKTE